MDIVSQKHAVKISLLCFAWVVTWTFTQGIYMSSGLQGLLSGSLEYRLILITVVIATVLCIALVALRGEAKKFIMQSKWLMLYILPILCIFLLQFRYQGPISLGLFVAMILVSVAWQDILTFGFLQNKIRTLTSTRATVLIVGTAFGLGHIIAIIPDISQLATPGFYLLFIVGFLFAWLRQKTGAIYVVNILHTTFLLATMIR